MNKLKLNFNKNKKLELTEEELELIEDWLGDKYAGDMSIPAIIDFSLENDIEDIKITNYLIEKSLKAHNKKH
ncbi:hypothetical protein NYR90_11165 [Clostridioides difficile]|nr:hypothetical protein NYR90_11165 [Clostridioides difficile]